MMRRCCRLHAAAVVPRGTERVPLEKLGWGVGAVVEGFVCIGVKHVPDLNVSGYEFRHRTTGARFVHFDTDDTNNAFNITFCTPATSNKGTTHVLEHTALCGSEKYPVRDPFFLMLRRSLNTFMNAMTGPDYTMYPFSTTNIADYSNLLDVYLDAVLHPLLRSEDFRQEGHRVELSPTKSTAAEADGGSVAAPAEGAEEGEAAAGVNVEIPISDRRAEVNGVVYNEMRGVVTQPSTHMMQSIFKECLPNTHYQYQSGGQPIDVLKLTHEELVEFHRVHYHPSNSIVMTYGDMPPNAHMAKINERFSQFERSAPFTASKLAAADRMAAPKTVQLDGPPDLMGDLTKQKRVSVSYVVPDEVDNSATQLTKLSVLSDLMMTDPSSPMYQALILSQMGARFSTLSGYASFLSSPTLSFGVEGVDENGPHTTQAIEDAVVKAIEKTKETGFDQRRVDSVVFQEELQQRHRSTTFGINLTTGLSALVSTRNHLQPLDLLYTIPDLKQIQKHPEELLTLLEQTTLKNPHRVTLEVKSSDKFLEHMSAEITEHENIINAELTKEKKEALQKENEEWLERVKAPTDPACLPSLSVSDIAPEGFKEPEPVQFNTAIDTASVYTIPAKTNGLVYVHGQIPFDPKLVAETTGLVDTDPQRLAQLRSPLFHRLLTRCGAGKFDFENFEVETKLCCGGIHIGSELSSIRSSTVDMIGATTFSFYTTKEKLQESLDMLHLALTAPVVRPRDEKEKSRMISLINATASSVVAGLQHKGHVYAMNRACSVLAPSCAIGDVMTGLTQATWLKQFQGQLQEGGDVSAATLDSFLLGYESFVADLQQRMPSMRMWATCEEGTQQEVEPLLGNFVSNVATAATTAAERTATSFSLELAVNGSGIRQDALPAEPEVCELPMDTSFVGLALPTGLAFGDSDQQKVRLACQILQNTFLHQKVREEGGAYGAMAGATLQGDAGGITLGSYRDPTPDKTLQTLQKCGEFLSDSNNITQRVVDEAKLRLFAKLDAPVSPDTYGASRFSHKSLWTEQQKSRAELLALTPEDIITTTPSYFERKGSFAVLRPTATKE